MTTAFVPDSQRSDRIDSARRHCNTATMYERGSRPGYCATSGQATKDLLPASTSYSGVSVTFTSGLPVDENRRSRSGLTYLWTTLRNKSYGTHYKYQKRQCQYSISCADSSSLDVMYSRQSYVQASCRSADCKPAARADVSALVPDYLDDPPPYSDVTREREDEIDWQAHFDKTPLLTTTVSRHSSPAVQDVISPGAPVGGAWDRVARRVGR